MLSEERARYDRRGHMSPRTTPGRDRVSRGGQTDWQICRLTRFAVPLENEGRLSEERCHAARWRSTSRHPNPVASIRALLLLCSRMMRRPTWLRLPVAVLALCLGSALVGSSGWGACPMQDGQGGTMADMPGMPGAHAEVGAHAEHGQRDRSGNRSQPCCNCIGLCTGAGGMPTPPAGHVVALARASVPRQSLVPVAAPRQPAHLPLIPFATAPPLA